MICHPVVRTGEERVRRSSKIECLRRLRTDTGSDPCPGTRYVHAESHHSCHARRSAASYLLDILAFHTRDRRLALQYRHDRGGVTLRHRREVRPTPGCRQSPTNRLTCRHLSGPNVRTCQMTEERDHIGARAGFHGRCAGSGIGVRGSVSNNCPLFRVLAAKPRCQEQAWTARCCSSCPSRYVIDSRRRQARTQRGAQRLAPQSSGHDPEPGKACRYQLPGVFRCPNCRTRRILAYPAPLCAPEAALVPDYSTVTPSCRMVGG